MPEDLLQRLTFEASQNWELKVLLSLATIAGALVVKWITVQAHDSKVVLTAHYPTKPGDRLASQPRVTRQILKQFSAAELRLV